MATYKVIQDIEAEDKLVGPLTLRQFIFAGISAICLYLSFLSLTKHAAFLLALFLPIAAFTGFFAFPWGRDQPTEVWALAKIRFALKPRKRIWDQSGAKDLVTITVPKKIERMLTNGLDQDEVRSRLSALADTIDTRGWAIKNVNVNMTSYSAVMSGGVSDRLVGASSLPQAVSDVDVRASDDIMDASANPIAQHFDTMINASSQAHRQQIINQLQQPAAPPAAPAPTPSQPANNYWFMNQGASVPGQATFVDAPVVVPGMQQPVRAPQALAPTAEEEALVAKFKAENSNQTVAYGHMKVIKTSEELAAEAAQAAVAQAAAAVKPPVTPVNQAAIINLAQNNDLDVATIARQAHKQAEDNDGEVVISLR
jgi:hypothetical protein